MRAALDGAGLTLRHGWKPGVVGEVVRAHAVHYAPAFGFGQAFEAKVAHELGAFVARYDPSRDRLLWVEDASGGLVGSLTIDGHDPGAGPDQARLRWFIVTETARGRGVGTALMDAAESFLREAGFRSCYLTTVAGLDPARHLYERAGFVLVAEQEAESWGRPMREQRFAMAVPAGPRPS